MDATLFIDLARTSFTPGDLIRGEIFWALDKQPGKIVLSLGWWTEGRGNKDAKLETELEWKTNETAGKESFEMQLPIAPYSFEGHLVALKWALELRAAKGNKSTSLDIIISPTGLPVSLPLIEDESKRKSFSFNRNR
jgi:hypothetical protein